MPVRTSNLDPAFERALREVLYDRKLPCPHCRYNLSGLVRPVCPECGHNVEAHLRIADLSPGRLRRERIERIARGVWRAFLVIVVLAPLVVLGVLALS